MEISMEIHWKSMEISMEIHLNFHGRPLKGAPILFSRADARRIDPMCTLLAELGRLNGCRVVFLQ